MSSTRHGTAADRPPAPQPGQRRPARSPWVLQTYGLGIADAALRAGSGAAITLPGGRPAPARHRRAHGTTGDPRCSVPCRTGRVQVPVGLVIPLAIRRTVVASRGFLIKNTACAGPPALALYFERHVQGRRAVLPAAGCGHVVVVVIHEWQIQRQSTRVWAASSPVGPGCKSFCPRGLVNRHGQVGRGQAVRLQSKHADPACRTCLPMFAGWLFPCSRCSRSVVIHAGGPRTVHPDLRLPVRRRLRPARYFSHAWPSRVPDIGLPAPSAVRSDARWRDQHSRWVGAAHQRLLAVVPHQVLRPERHVSPQRDPASVPAAQDERPGMSGRVSPACTDGAPAPCRRSCAGTRKSACPEIRPPGLERRTSWIGSTAARAPVRREAYSSHHVVRPVVVPPSAPVRATRRPCPSRRSGTPSDVPEAPAVVVPHGRLSLASSGMFCLQACRRASAGQHPRPGTAGRTRIDGCRGSGRKSAASGASGGINTGRLILRGPFTSGLTLQVGRIGRHPARLISGHRLHVLYVCADHFRRRSASAAPAPRQGRHRQRAGITRYRYGGQTT